MPVEIKRKLYTRGSSFETTIPMPILFKIDQEKKHNVLFKYDPEKDRWYIDFEETQDKMKTKSSKNQNKKNQDNQVKKRKR